MVRKLSKANNSQAFYFTTSTRSLSRRFRVYCMENELVLSAVIEDAMMEYLIKRKKAKTKEEFDIEDSLGED